MLESFIYSISGGGDVDACIATARAGLAADRQNKPELSRAALWLLDQIDDYARQKRHPRVTEPVENEAGRQVGTKLVDEGDGVQGTISVTMVDFGALATPPRT